MAHWKDAVVEDRKVLDYLLSPEHPVGGDKAAFFLAIGCSRQEWTTLRDDLKRIAKDGELVTADTSHFGVKYVVDGVIESPSGKVVSLRTVWISDSSDGPLRLVTAYPG